MDNRGIDGKSFSQRYFEDDFEGLSHYHLTPLGWVQTDPELDRKRSEVLRELKPLLEKSILRFKTKQSIFLRTSDNKHFERTFEPCVKGRIWDWKDVEWKQEDGSIRVFKTLIFQTDRGFWYVRCKTAKKLRQMVLDYTPELHNKLMMKSLLERGYFWDEITGITGSIKEVENGYSVVTMPNGEQVTIGPDKAPLLIYMCFTDYQRSKETPWEVGCA